MTDAICADPQNCGRGPYPTLCGPCDEAEREERTGFCTACNAEGELTDGYCGEHAAPELTDLEHHQYVFGHCGCGYPGCTGIAECGVEVDTGPCL